MRMSQMKSALIAYFISRMVIVLDLKSQQQAFYEGHTTKVTSIAAHPSRLIMASSNCEFKASIDIWQASSFNRLAVVNTGHSQAINCLKFSSDGSFIGSVGVDQYFSIQITKWSTGTVVGFRNTSNKPIIEFEFNPTDKYQFATGTYNSISLWFIGNRSIILKNLISMNSLDKNNFPYATCLAYVRYRTTQEDQSDIIVANNFGDLGVITNHAYFCAKQTAHKKMINSLIVYGDAKPIIITGSEDEYIKIWSISFDILAEFNLRECRIVELVSTVEVCSICYPRSAWLYRVLI